MSIIIEGYYGYGSLADETILEGLIFVVKKLGPIKVTVISSDPHSTSKLHSVVAIKKSLKQWITNIPIIISKSDCYIFGGGNLLHDKSFYTLPAFLFRVFIVKILRKKFFVISQGIGPIRTTFGKFQQW